MNLDSLTVFNEQSLKEVGASIIAMSMQALEQVGSFPSLILLVTPVGIVDFKFPMEVMNSAAGKLQLAAQVRRLSKEYKAEVVVFLSDAWMLEAKEHPQVHMDEIVRLGARGAAAAGYGELHEVIQCMVQTPLLTVSMSQVYKRLDGKIEYGPRQVMSTAESGARLEGKMVFFDQPKESVQ